MTRRAKERRMERVRSTLQLREEKLERDRRLSSRPSWIQLLAALDGPFASSTSSSLHVSNSANFKHQPSIVDELQWKSLQVPIAASGGFQLPIKLDAQKGELHYSFSTKDYDVNFGVQMIDAYGSPIELLGTQRYESQKQQVKGKLSLTGPGLLLLLWDNSFSWVNAKRLAYHVELKQEALPVSDDEKTQLALKARFEREQKFVHTEGEYNFLETQLQTEAQTIDLLHHQIEELHLQLKKHEECREIFINEKKKVKNSLEDLYWELRALSWRCLDQATLHLIMSFLTDQDLTAWMLTSKKWYERGHVYHTELQESAES
ncbi:fyve and coiled-coil domain-containing protein 1 [Plasmopara halstedii]|uniref:Fyve and coiled-coil domain-containing protein 1 n=1 Tax=Plasmopara halstedii TaxID=4781 RepID=A0A0N7L3G3_PLAHL|nr:fyve and coiled-coil domain-containing protein 1 [Plasmopara halstedii]CEG35795.1 fyve and coiled-coil domain-containing protein 1 [Plasmopara halstedii]|eukprot:XP_024572164.1 fyve and coiled-coil domain-containing protein 1 [Plasmopara halstedii]